MTHTLMRFPPRTVVFLLAVVIQTGSVPGAGAQLDFSSRPPLVGEPGGLTKSTCASGSEGSPKVARTSSPLCRRFPIGEGASRRLEACDTAGWETRATTLSTAVVAEPHAAQTGLTRAMAEGELRRIWEERARTIRDQRRADLESDIIRAGDQEMRLLRREFGEPGSAGRSLWISMHGGGGAPASLNDRQWANQIKLYKPAEGVYVAPRAPANTWDLWHRPEIDRLFDRLIETAIAVWNVDPDKVYLLGYSAGGDGVYQLAPRMADRFAAASMMAGHPNDASPEGLRNLPFAIFMGANDAAYNRNKVAEEWGRKLGELRADDPNGYPHRVTIYPELGHWMQGRDAEALPWMAAFVRNPWPDRVIWQQGNVPHRRFYWLAVAEEDAVRGRIIKASVRGQTIELESAETMLVELLLRDELLDLDQPVRVLANGHSVFDGRVHRSIDAIHRTLEWRGDPRAAATATLRVVLTAPDA